MKKPVTIFITAFVLNLTWENLHSLLYDNNMGGPITGFILFSAAIADAAAITAISVPFLHFSYLKKHNWLIIAIGILIAIMVEKYALINNMWAYNTYMPIIPLLNIGLTPTVQLGLLGYLSFKIYPYFQYLQNKQVNHTNI